jgi:hypothetical protein
MVDLLQLPTFPPAFTVLEAASDSSHAAIFGNTLSEFAHASPDIGLKWCQIAGARRIVVRSGKNGEGVALAPKLCATLAMQ